MNSMAMRPRLLPLALQVHHAVCDGFHACRLVREAQELLIVKANVDRILQNTERGGNAQEKGTVSFAANCALY